MTKNNLIKNHKLQKLIDKNQIENITYDKDKEVLFYTDLEGHSFYCDENKCQANQILKAKLSVEVGKNSCVYGRTIKELQESFKEAYDQGFINNLYIRFDKIEE